MSTNPNLGAQAGRSCFVTFQDIFENWKTPKVVLPPWCGVQFDELLVSGFRGSELQILGALSATNSVMVKAKFLLLATQHEF